jgi:hypothetical protein
MPTTPHAAHITLQKIGHIAQGQSAVMSDQELDWLIDNDLYPLHVVSIPNPERCGLLDAYLVAHKTHPACLAYAKRVTEAYEARPEILAYRHSLSN